MTYYQVPPHAKIKIGEKVKMIQKIHYETGQITEGTVKDILTSRPTHPRGIKVRLTNGLVGRVLALGGEEVKAVTEVEETSNEEGEGVALTENDLV